MQRIGSYVLSQRIGAGGMAEVWMAQRATLGASKIVAVKLLASHLATKQQYRDMFLEEARLSMLLNNSNIVQTFDAGEDAGECYMAMEWIDGANLAELQAALWESGRVMPVDVAMYIAGEVLRALDYAHNLVHEGAATIVHRDVSPANIMLSMAGEVKLTDFGVARFGTDETSGLHVKGKLRYMPPEQLRGQSKEGTVDIFSVGAVLHEMLDGDRFRGAKTDEAELLGLIFSGVVPELRDPGRVCAELDDLRRRMLAAEVGQRVPSAREALQQLRRCPGYRQASHELEALVRWYRGLDPSDSGYRPGRFAQVLPAIAGQAADTSVSRVGVALPGQPSSRWRANLSGRSVQRMIAAVVVAFLGLCVGCFGVGFAVSNLGSELAEPELEPEGSEGGSEWLAALDDWSRAARSHAESNPEGTVREDGGMIGGLLGAGEGRMKPLEDEIVAVPPTSESPPSQPEEPPPPPEPPPSEPPEQVIEDEPDAEEPEQPVEKKPAPPPKPKVKHDPVNVKFVAGQFGFAYIKVGTKRFLIEPYATIQLVPGSHKVYVRTDDDGKWVYFGKIEVKPKQASTTVQLVKPKSLKVTP